MSSISRYITELKNINSNFDFEVGKIILENKGKILSMIKLRLFNKGIDGSGSSILPSYRTSTVISKRKKNQRTSHVTLRDKGSFYKGMFITYKNDSIFIDSNVQYKLFLTRKYGEDILSLTEQEQQFIIDSIIEPGINKLINSIGQITIDF